MLSDRDVAIRLYDIGAIKFGTFKLASGILSPYYVDLRLVPAYHDVFEEVETEMLDMLRRQPDMPSRFCAIPTTGLALVGVISWETGIPFIFYRKEVKEHGTGKRIEGVMFNGDRIAYLDDVLTSGGSILEGDEAVRSEATRSGVTVYRTDAYVFLDREQGGIENLAKAGLQARARTTTREIAKILLDVGKMSDKVYDDINEYIIADRKTKGLEI